MEGGHGARGDGTDAVDSRVDGAIGERTGGDGQAGAERDGSGARGVGEVGVGVRAKVASAKALLIMSTAFIGGGVGFDGDVVKGNQGWRLCVSRNLGGRVGWLWERGLFVRLCCCAADEANDT